MKKLIARHPRSVRWTHWINAVLLSGMIVSGFMIAAADEPFTLDWGNKRLLELLPWRFYSFLGLQYRLYQGIAWHFFLMWLFAANGILYLLFLSFGGGWRALRPGPRPLRTAWQTLLRDLHLRREVPVHDGYNPAQRIAYISVILMGIGLVVTGLAILKPTQLSGLTWLLGGYRLARCEHFLLTLAMLGFIAVHLIQVARAGWNNFRSMVAGYELTDDEARLP